MAYGLPPLGEEDDLDTLLQQEYGLQPLSLDTTQGQELEDPGFLERFGASMAGVQLPQGGGFGGGLLSGLAGGLASRGQRLAQQRQKAEAASVQRQAARDAANRQATQRYLSDKASALGKRSGEVRASKKEQEKYERENPVVTPEDVEANPGLARLLGKPAPLDWRKPAAPKTGLDAMTPAQRIQYEKDLAKARAEGTTAGGGGPKGKPPTEVQARAGMFHSRAAEAVKGLEVKGGLEDKMLGQAWGLRAPYAVQNDDQRLYSQAVESFALALNRLESGAAIAPTEFSKVKALYFVQPGDNARTIENKRRLRKNTIDNLLRMAGSAADPNAVPDVAADTGEQQLDIPPTWQEVVE